MAQIRQFMSKSLSLRVVRTATASTHRIMRLLLTNAWSRHSLISGRRDGRRSKRGVDLGASHFRRDHVGRRQVDVAYHVLRLRCRGEKTKAQRSSSERSFHRQLRRRRT
jgi:hypothetical protein